MSETAPLFALYEALWRGEDSVWSDGEIAFMPFDDYAILREAETVTRHWRRRRDAWALTAADFTPLASWAENHVHMTIGRLTLTLRPREGGAEQRRDLRFVITARQHGERWRLIHVAEAAEAALVDMIGGYHAEAAGAIAP